MGCSNAKEIYVNSQDEVDKNRSDKLQVQYFACHGRATGLRCSLYYMDVDFHDDQVSIPAGFIKRKVCGPMKYGSLPKIRLENGTVLHQTCALYRYVGNRFKGSKGECMYPSADCPMQRYWCDVALDKYNGFVGKCADEFMSDLSPKYKEYEKNCKIFMEKGGFWDKYLCDLDMIKTANGCKAYILGDCISLVDTATIANFYKVLMNPNIPKYVHELGAAILQDYPALCAWFECMKNDNDIKTKVMPKLMCEKWHF